MVVYERVLQAGVVDIVRGSEAEDDYFLDIHDYEDRREGVREILDLLGIEVDLSGAPIFLPLRQGVGSSTSAINLEHRSAKEVLDIFGTGIEVPAPHLDAGIIEPIQWPLPEERRAIRIRSSEKRPKHATVRIRFRDWWFYVEATDTKSKRAFSFLRTFIGMRLQEAGSRQPAPVITIPVN
jgi:hypothetical protein